MDAVRDADAAATAELAQWCADVRMRALARRTPAPVRAPWRVWLALCATLIPCAIVIHRLTPAPRSEPASTSLQIFLRDTLPAAPEPPLAVPPPARELPPLPAALPPADASAANAAPAAADDAASPADATPTLHVFNPDGSIDLPREPAPRRDALVANFAAPPRSADALRVMTHQRPLKVRPNHFDRNFRAPSGSALTDFVADHLTASKEFTLPWGTHVECKGVALGVAFVGGCGWYTPYRYYVPEAPWRPASVLDEQ